MQSEPRLRDPSSIEVGSAAGESDPPFASAFKRGAVGLAQIAPDGSLLRVNPKLCHMTGCRREELLQRTFQELVAPEDRTESENARRRMLAGELPMHCLENRIRRKDGKVFWGHVVTTLVRDTTGNPKCFLCVITEVTDSRSDNPAIKEAEERYRALFERSMDAVFLADLRGRFLDANPAALNLFGYAREEVHSLDFSALVTSEQDLEHAYQSLRDLVTSGTQKEIAQYRLKRKDGSMLWVELLSSLVFQGGRPIAVQGIARDISARKAAEAALAESEARFRAIFEHAGVGITMVDCECGQILHCNQALARMLDFSVTELRRLTINDITYPPDLPRNQMLIEDLLAGRVDRVVTEKRYRRGDGEVIWGLLMATLVRGEAGEPRFIIGMIEDITEQRNAREKLEQGAALLRIAGKVSRLGGWTIELPERKLTWSDETCLIHDLPPGHQPTLEEGIAFFPPEYRAEVLRHVDLCAREGTPYDFEVPKMTAKGRRIWVRCIGTAVRNSNGNIVRLQGAFQDVTERKKLEDQFLRAQRLESIGTLASGIAHDLNNILTPILMSIDVLKMAEPIPKHLDLLGTIEDNAKRGADMVKQVLSFARGLEGNLQVVQIRHLLWEIKRIADQTFPKNIRVRAAIPSNLWTVSADPTQIHQVLLNLCINARDAMPEGGSLTLSAKNVELDARSAILNPGARPGRHMLLQVEDSGAGMPSEILDRIFDPFFSTKQTGKGTGLGLSTSLAIIKSHGGFIRVYSEPGRGSKFQVYLPADDKSASHKAYLPPPDLPRGHGEVVLVVDDEASVRKITRHTLEDFGYRVLLACNGAAAVAAYAKQKNEIDAVITDMMMPVMGGQTAIELLRKINPQVRIIATSGLGAAPNGAAALQTGANYFLSKPFSTSALLKILQKALP